MTTPAYRAEWDRPPYNEGGRAAREMGSAGMGPPPPAPFWRLWNLTSAEHAISTIQGRRLKVSLISELNDPFELLGYDLGDPEIRKLFETLRAELDTAAGFVCMSRDWMSSAMWAHYGDRHHGVALGIDVDATKRELLRVNYSKERLKVEVQRTGLVRTKSDEWAYEDEVRMLVDLETTVIDLPHHFIPFDGTLRLGEVILGMHCELREEDVRRQVAKLYPGQEVRVFRTRRANKWFRVVPDSDPA